MSFKQEIIEKDKQYIFHHLIHHANYMKDEPPIWVKGDGIVITNIHGEEVIDACAGAVKSVCLGYGQKRIVQAIAKQLEEMPYYVMSAGNIPAAKLAEKIVSVMPGAKRRVYFSNSGSEANEKAFKIARQYSRKKFGVDKHKILYRYRDYHGTTFAALSATGQPERRMAFGPFLSGFTMVETCDCYRCPFGKTYPGCDIECAKDLERTIIKEGPDTVAAFIAEPITANGGVLMPVPEYFPMIERICKKYNILLIIDDVVCGWGRTGKWFGYQHFDCQPDIVTMAKGMASGYMPISATVIKDEIFQEFLDPEDKYGYFRDISTYAGCAACHAASLEVFNIISENNYIEVARQKGDYLKEKVVKECGDLSVVGRITCVGLYAGLEIVMNRETKEFPPDAMLAQVCAETRKNGVMIAPMKAAIPDKNNVLSIGPAFIVTEEQLDKIVLTMRDAIKKVFGCR